MRALPRPWTVGRPDGSAAGAGRSRARCSAHQVALRPRRGGAQENNWVSLKARDPDVTEGQTVDEPDEEAILFVEVLVVPGQDIGRGEPG